MKLESDSIPLEIDRRNGKYFDVPAYELVLWRHKCHNSCVVIPVVNEGGRIIRLLDRMNEVGISSIADIFIVDGGSTDGSLEEDALRRRRLRGLIRKLGPGKLGAQLRCGYFVALSESYQNIITIDGNNKDDPAWIPSFIKKLDEGFDFVQGSRFIAGGLHENTPRWREWAIRWIHAPFLSQASGFRWTDTTQGFRGYSQKLLLSEKLQIFRSVFSGYELLAFLSYKAPRVGLRCIEVPCSRVYPSGRIPTKISFISGNLTLLKVLFKACFGLYDPAPADSNR